MQQLSGKDLKASIQASEGRVVLSEVIGTSQPMYPEVTNAEMAAAIGADLILMNIFDVFQPMVNGVTANAENLVGEIKRLTGRPVGINLEPIDPHAERLEDLNDLPIGRTAADESLKKAYELGVDFVCFTGNPQTGVTNPEIESAIKRAREIFQEDVMIIAGKMHGAGVAGEQGGEIITDEWIEKFIQAGADVLLMPPPGTIPGITVEHASHWAKVAHKKGVLVMTTIGTSQEGADQATIRQTALHNKMVGADIHHLGDAGYTGLSIPENIMDYSIVIRGKRHTYLRMARSINR
ncbi:haloacid dehalogenase-like hydrolase [Allobacillus sp. GCM10007491]|uniref:DUF7916 family protein n=1 Tax=Allobacillus TaxID=1400133 RepID=UPI001F174E32|nr:haloacid dehalogenase-like hydrolase [Allobacillus saliphilus]